MQPVVAEPTTITFRRRGLRVREVYFDDEPGIARRGSDLVRVLGVPAAAVGRASRKSHTAVVDLTLATDDLLAAMAKGTRYEIRRAEDKDDLDATAYDAPGPELVTEFADYYDEFARSKELSPIFRPRLRAMAEAGMLTLTRAPEQGDALVWHAYARSSRHALLLYSASLFRATDDKAERAAAGRANRFLHWFDMRHFKMSGCVSYDLGGLDIEGRAEQTARIASFKRGFGGLVRPTYAWSSPTTVRGKVAQAALGAIGVDF
jgi:CRISPR-associated Cas5-like protein